MKKVVKEANLFLGGSVCLGADELRLTSNPGQGKVSDAGYDQFISCYTQLPSDADFMFSAQVKVTAVPGGPAPTYQEAFGLFIRDIMDNDSLTGYPYSNMAAVGSYYGVCNFFGRSGISKESIEEGAPFFFDKTEDSGHTTRIMPGSVFMMCIGLRGKEVISEITDENGRDVLSVGKDDRQPISSDDFKKRDPDQVFIGFFVTSGYEICIEKSSIDVKIKETDALNVKNRVIYTSPNGSAQGDGALGNPYDLKTAVEKCSDGMTVLLLPGIYICPESLCITSSMSGSKKARKKLAASERGQYPVLDFCGTRNALRLQGDHWDIEGISVTRGEGFCISGSCNNITDCRAYRNLETGFLIRYPDINDSKDLWPSNNIVADCISWLNCDKSEHNADGFACKVAAGTGNCFDSCIAFLNSDDGFDLFAKNRKIGAVTVRNCKSYFNGYMMNYEGRLVKTEGNGNGFKLGGSGLVIEHKAEDCISAGNKKAGFSSNSNPYMKLIRCTAENNKPNISFYYSSRSCCFSVCSST